MQHVKEINLSCMKPVPNSCMSPDLGSGWSLACKRGLCKGRYTSQIMGTHSGKSIGIAVMQE